MAYTTPDTAVTGVVAPAAMWNSGVRDNLLAMMHPIARKTADQSVTSSTAFVDDTHLFTPSIPANEVWKFHLQLRVQPGAGGQKHSFSFPSGGTMNFVEIGVHSGGTQYVQQPGEFTTSDANSTTTSTFASNNLYLIEALYIQGGTAGVVTFRWAQTSSNATASIVRTHSTLWGAKLSP